MQFGSSDIPKVLPYPKLLEFGKELHNVYCYIIEHYGYDGLSVLVYKDKKSDDIVVLCGDWYGNNIDIDDDQEKIIGLTRKFLVDDLNKFINMMYAIKITQAQYFFAVVGDELMLVDMQVAINKLVGPGMIRDIFGKIYRTQEVRKIEVIDTRVIEQINLGVGSYSDNLIIKPSRFRMYHDQVKNTYQPMYAEVKR